MSASCLPSKSHTLSLSAQKTCCFAALELRWGQIRGSGNLGALPHMRCMSVLQWVSMKEPPSSRNGTPLFPLLTEMNSTKKAARARLSGLLSFLEGEKQGLAHRSISCVAREGLSILENRTSLSDAPRLQTTSFYLAARARTGFSVAQGIKELV